ncbi:MAG: Kelch repeat-containing protein [Candidatus Hodarchaeota archaeon]
MRWNRFGGRSWRVVWVVGVFFMLTLTKGGPAPVVSIDTAESGDTWRRVADMPTPRWGLAAVVMDSKIYAIGGAIQRNVFTTTVEEYDPITDTWRSRAAISTPRAALAAAVVDGKIYAIGGSSDEKALALVEEYDPITDTWRSRAAMSTPRAFLDAAVVGGKIYAIGGRDENWNIFSTVEEYDPITDTWRSRAPIPTARSHIGTAVVNEKIYVVGGFDGTEFVATVEVYDPATDTWTSRANMLITQEGSAEAVVGGKIYVAGGQQTRYGPPIAILEEYDPVTDIWRNRAAMSIPRATLAAVGLGNKIYALGGITEEKIALSTVEEYTPPSSPEAPIVTVMSPNGGEYWQGTQPITWEATDPQDDPLTFAVSYSLNGGATWTQLATGLTEPSCVWDTTMVVDGTNYLVKVEVSDGMHTGVDVSDAPFEIANAPPITTTTIVPPIIPVTTYPANVQTETVPYGGYLRLAFFIDPKEDWWVKWSFTGSNPEVGIKAMVMEFGESFKFVQGMSYDAYPLSEGKTSDSGTFTIPYTAQWAFMFVNLDSSQQSTTLTVTLQLIETAIQPPNSAPTVRVLRPNGGERVRGMYELRWEANDPDGDVLTFTISYSPNGGQTWTQLARGLTETSYQWDTSTVQVGSNYLIKVEASDGALTADDRSDAPFTIEREAETETKGVFIPSFGIVEVLGAIFLLLCFRKLQRTRIS